jgi:hypothetical protein
MLKPKILINPREKLSAKYYDYLNIFSRILAERLFSPRFNIDYKIILKKTLDKKNPKIL